MSEGNDDWDQQRTLMFVECLQRSHRSGSRDAHESQTFIVKGRGAHCS